jgi:hypothetical protein
MLRIVTVRIKVTRSLIFECSKAARAVGTLCSIVGAGFLVGAFVTLITSLR